MELTNEQTIQLKLSALEASLKLESINPTKPIYSIDLDKIPQEKTADEFMKDWNKEMYQLPTTYCTPHSNPFIIDIGTATVINRAQEIFSWLKQ